MPDQTELSVILGGTPTPAPAEVEAVEAPEVEATVEAPVDEAAAETPPEAPKATEKPRDDAGRFKADEQQMVPLAAMLAERDKARDLERRLAAAQPKPAEPPKAPNVFDDPDKFTAFLTEQAQSAATAAKLDISEALARDKFGDERVDLAFEAFKAKLASDPTIYDKTMAAKSPWHKVVEWHEAEQARAAIGDDPNAYRAKVEAEVRAKIAAEMAEKKVVLPPPPSLATQTNLGSRAAPSWGGATPLGKILGR